MQSKEKTMTKNFVENVIETNKDAAITATKNQAGKIALNAVRDVARKTLPSDLAIQADSPIGILVIANIMSQLVPTMTTNELAIDLSQKALVAAYEEAFEALGIHTMVNQFVSNVVSLDILKTTTK